MQISCRKRSNSPRIRPSVLWNSAECQWMCQCSWWPHIRTVLASPSSLGLKCSSHVQTMKWLGFGRAPATWWSRQFTWAAKQSGKNDNLKRIDFPFFALICFLGAQRHFKADEAAALFRAQQSGSVCFERSSHGNLFVFRCMTVCAKSGCFWSATMPTFGRWKHASETPPANSPKSHNFRPGL